MRKHIGWLLLLAAVGAAAAMMPFQSSDVAQLVPIEALVISMDQGQVVVAGGGCQGRGDTWDEAWRDFQESGSGTVFLGTAEQVILAGGAVKLLPEVAWNEQLRPAANICVTPGKAPDPEEAAAYLSAHNGGVRLQQVRAALLQDRAIDLPVLVETKGGLRLYGTEYR